MVGNMLITMNRFSALCLKEKYDKIWSRRNVRIILALHFTCAFATSTPLFAAEYVFIQNNDGTFKYMGLDKRSDLIIRCVYVAAPLLYAVVSLILNTQLLIELRRLLKVSESGRHVRHEKVSKQLYH
ncbi:hypothetical protein OSTOST_12544 [Ostertagia ostertagi]